MKRIVFLLLISMFILAACGGGDDDESDGGLEGVSSENTPTTVNEDSEDAESTGDSDTSDNLVANIPAIEANIFEMPTIDGLEGRLLFVQGNTKAPNPRDGDAGRLFLANFDGSQPQMLATRVYTTSLTLLPDQSKMFYVAIDGRSWYAYLLDLATLESTQLMRLEGQFGGISGWSPDGRWLTVNNPPPVGSGQFLMNTDGSFNYKVGNGGIIWTKDSQFIFMGIQSNSDFNAPPVFTSIELIDPVTQERTPLDLPINLEDLLNIPGNMFFEMLEDAGYGVVSNYATASLNGASMLLPDETTYLNVQALTPNNATTNSPVFCGQFELSEILLGSSETNTLYEVNNTVTITDIQLHESGYFFQRWFLSNCEYGLDNLNIALEYVASDETAQVITSTLYPGTGVNPSFIRINNGFKYTVSPDGRYVIWIDGSFASITTTLKITDLETNETADLMTWTSSSANNFVIFDAFTSVLWVE